jgi:hypothetical protein
MTNDRRDDGPLAELAGRAAPPLPAGPLSSTVAGAIALAVALASASAAVVVAGVLALLLLAGAASRRRHDGRLDWAVPAVLRAAEYAALVRITAVYAPDAMPACLAFLAAVAFHHYDTVYRPRPAAPALRRAGLGWDGRLLVVAVAAVAGVLGPVLAVGAAALLLLYVGESVRSWAGAT